MHKYYQPLLPGETYHLWNRAVGDEKLFQTIDNYNYFLKKFSEHASNVCSTYCYCLMPNHFHFMIKILDSEILESSHRQTKKTPVRSRHDLYLSDFVMERLSNFLNGYTKAFNKMYNRQGGLFMDFTRRAIINDDHVFSKIVHYIHANPVHHGLCTNIQDWKYSSYKSILSNLPTKLLRNEVIEHFGSKENFIKFHQQPIDLQLPSHYD